MESTWKFVEIWSSTYRRNIYVECTSIRRGVPVGRALHALMSHGPYSLRALVSHMFRAVRVSYPSCFCASFVLFLLFIVSFCKCLMCLVLYVCYHTCSPALWPYVSYMHLVTCTLHDSSVISTFMDLCVHVARCSCACRTLFMRMSHVVHVACRTSHVHAHVARRMYMHVACTCACRTLFMFMSHVALL